MAVTTPRNVMPVKVADDYVNSFVEAGVGFPRRVAAHVTKVPLSKLVPVTLHAYSYT
jgi:hypothetical protein